MDNEFENNIPFDLISKVIAKEASNEEVAQITAWRKESEDHEKEYQNLAQIMGEVPVSVPQFDVNKAWSKVDAQIGSEEGKKSNAAKFFRLALVGCVALLAGVFFWPSSASLNTYVAQNDGEVLWLPDSSKVTLKKGAMVSYLPGFKGRFRRIDFKGEAFFNITRDTTKTFMINMNGPTVTVLGTSFNIKSSADSTEVVVNSGTVSFTKESPVLNKVKKHILKKGDAAVFNSVEDQISQPNFIDPTTLFYATKTLVFKETKMKEVVKVLSTVYDQQIEVGCAPLAEELYNGRLENIPLESAMEIISFTMDAEVEKAEGKLVFTQNACN